MKRTLHTIARLALLLVALLPAVAGAIGIEKNEKNKVLVDKNAFFEAAANGDLKKIKECIEQDDTLVNAKNDDGQTALHLAAACGKIEVVAYLVDEKKAAINARDKKLKTPLHLAAFMGHESEVKCLVAKGASVTKKDIEGKTACDLATGALKMWLLNVVEDDRKGNQKLGWTDLHFAADAGDAKQIKDLIQKKKIAIDVKDKDGNTALHIAAKNGYLEIVNDLVGAKATIDEHAITVASENVRKFLIENATVQCKKNITEIFENKKLDANEQKEKLGEVLLAALVNTRSSLVQYALFAAAKNGATETFKGLVEKSGADIQENEDKGQMIFNVAARSGALDIVEYLITKKNVKADLPFAVKTENLDLVKLLVKHGATIDGTVIGLATGGVKAYLIEQSLAKHKEEITNIINSKNMSELEMIKAAEKVLETVIVSDQKNYLCKNFFAHLAVAKGKKAIVEHLIKEKKIDVNAKDATDKTNLDLAVANRDLAIVKLLVENGANAASKTNLGLAVTNGDLAIVKLLVEKGADATAIVDDITGNTILHVACQAGHREIVEYLHPIARHAKKIDVKNKNGKTAADLAQQDGVKNYFKERASVQYKRQIIKIMVQDSLSESEKITALGKVFEAVSSIDSKDYYDLRPFACCKAASMGACEILKYLIEEKKTDVNAVDEQGWTALCVGALYGQKAVVDYLIAKRADVNAHGNAYGRTALYCAVKAGNLEIVKALLTKNAKVDIKDERNGETALQLALRKSGKWPSKGKKCPLDIIKALVEKRAKLGVICKPEDIASPYYSVGDYSRKLQGYKTVLKFSHQDKIKVSVGENANGVSSLHLAINYGRLDVIKYLIEEAKVSNIIEKDEQGRTVLHLAADHSDLEVLKYLVQLFAKQGETIKKAKINEKDADGRTPLHYAAEHYDLEMCIYLIENGATIDAKDNKDMTILHIACKLGRSLEFIKHLVELFAKKGLKDILNAKDSTGKTALDYANDNEKLEGKYKDSWSHDKLSLAEEIVKYLGENGAKVGKEDYFWRLDENEKKEKIENLREEREKENLEKQPKAKKLSLENAVWERDFDVVKRDIDNWADVNKENGHLLWSANVRDENAKICKFLVENGAKIDPKDRKGQTILHLAFGRGNKKFIEYLVKKQKVDTTIWDDEGKTAYDTLKQEYDEKDEDYEYKKQLLKPSENWSQWIARWANNACFGVVGVLLANYNHSGFEKAVLPVLAGLGMSHMGEEKSQSNFTWHGYLNRNKWEKAAMFTIGTLGAIGYNQLCQKPKMINLKKFC